MAREEHAHANLASSTKDSENLLSDLLRVLDLTQNSNLHVVNEQSDASRIAHLFDFFGNLNAVCAFHDWRNLTVGRLFNHCVPQACDSKRAFCTLNSVSVENESRESAGFIHQQYVSVEIFVWTRKHGVTLSSHSSQLQ